MRHSMHVDEGNVVFMMYIYNYNKLMQLDKLKHIRKEAASRKAQLLSAATSAATSASNSPEFSRHSQEPSNKSKE